MSKVMLFAYGRHKVRSREVDVQTDHLTHKWCPFCCVSYALCLSNVDIVAHRCRNDMTTLHKRVDISSMNASVAIESMRYV